MSKMKIMFDYMSNIKILRLPEGFSDRAREEKLDYLYTVFMHYPSVIDSLREISHKSESDIRISLVVMGQYEHMLRFLAEAIRDKDPAVSHFAKTTYRAVLDAGTAIIH